MNDNDYNIERLDWGVRDYLRSLEAMRQRHAARAAGQVADAIICVEHPKVFTLGKRGGREHILLGDEELAREGFSVYHVERGGDVTYHGPGQAVVYPVIDLRARRMGVRALVEAVAGAICQVTAEYGLTAAWDDERPGVWTHGRKIAAVGLAIPQRVSMHGLAFNVCPDLGHYRLIEACGLSAESTSLCQELGRPVSVTEVHDRLFAALCRQLALAAGSLGAHD